MAKARLYFDGDNTYIEKQARIYKMVDEIGDKIDNIPGVVNNLSSTSETDALSAAMGKELQDQINAMSGNFHFLSSWDCTTGLPGSDPAVDPYTYQSGDYYIVSTVAGSGGTNYKPHGSSYTHGVASTAVETQAVQMNDWYVYDGSTWILQPSGGAQIVIDTALSTTSTNPVENRVITQALNNKQDTIANLSTIESGAAAGATALQPGANITQLTNNAGYQTAGDVAAAILGKQDVLTAGEGIDITNNVVTNTGITCLTGGTDIEVVEGSSVDYTLPSGYTAVEYLESTGTQYIDTGIQLTQTNGIGFYIDYYTKSLFEESDGYGCILGGRIASGNNDLQFTTRTLRLSGNTGTVRWGDNQQSNQANANIISQNIRSQAQLINKVFTNTIVPSYSFTFNDYTWTDTTYPIYLFGLNNGGVFAQSGSGCAIYRAKLYNGSEVIADFVPCIRDSDNAPGMYDLVGETFKANAGTGTFTAGPEASDCTTVNFTNASGYMLKSSNKLIYATTDTAFNTRDKICTTADGNYSPTQGDVLALVFNNGCGVGSPRLNIDGSGLHDVSISTVGANASTFWLGMGKISWLFIYDGSRWITWPVKDTMYSAGTGLSLSNGTFSNTQPGPTIGTTAPSSPTEGAMRYDTTNHVLKVYNGTEWTEVGSGGGGGSTTWGNIGGILSNQTDLQDALDDKLEATDLVAGDGINITPVGSALPSGYTQVAYLALNGTQALDTGITGVGKSIEVDTLCTNTSASGWQIISSYGEDYLGMFFGVAGGYFAIQNNSSGKITTVDISARNTVTGRYSLSNNLNKVEIVAGGTTLTFTRTTARPDDNIHLGGAISTTNTLLYPYSGYIFGARIYNTTTNVEEAHYIPCINSINIAGFYDTVSDTFFPATKGTFAAGPAVPVEGLEISVDDTVWTDDNVVAGTGISIDTGTSARLPSGYTEVEWIQSDGACAIDSGITIAQMDKAVIVGNFVQNQGGFKSVLGADNQNASTGGKYAVIMGEGSGGQYYTESVEKVGSPSGARVDYVYSSAPVDTNEHTFQTYYAGTTAYFQVDNYTDTIQNCIRSTGVTTTLGIFARHLQVSDTFASSSTMFKMKSIKMRNGSNVVFEGVPCKRDSDNAIGLYDLVSETFLENEGSGTFTAGPAVTFDPTKIISSTVAGFDNLTYDSSANGNLTATTQQAVSFPSTAKVAFFTWTANNSTSGVRYASGQAVLFKNMFLTSFVGGGDSSNYINGQVGYDGSSYIIYTQDNASTNMRISYVVYFYK